ncbi:MAG: Smr/MutS family protein [Candidatus Methylomirabilales bacterium]
MPAHPGEGAGSPVPVPIEEVLDLHPFHPRDIASVVEEYLREAAARGFQEVRLIHGRGSGFQRQVVQDLLARHPQVLRFADAPPERGGWGATLVWLKPPRAGPTAPPDRMTPP